MSRPLSARSIIASTLLGTHPPRLPGRLLVALTEEFGITPGAARVALSRMVDRGDLRNQDGTYELIGHLVERQQRQDDARKHRAEEWDGLWELAIVPGGGRTARVRAEQRTACRAAMLAELREGVWLRPANLAPERPGVDAIRRHPSVVWGTLRPERSDAELAAELWDLAGWNRRAEELIDEMGSGERSSLRAGFELSAAVLRHFLADPELPDEMVPRDWSAGELRRVYDRFDAAYRDRLAAFFRAQRD